jgi:hypothetical protein
MKRWIALGVALSALSAAAHADLPSLCARLVDKAKLAPASNWASRNPLSEWVQVARPAAPARVAERLAADPRWRELLGLAPEEPLAVNSLPGTALHQIEHVGGSSACQRSVLAQVHPGQPAQPVNAPFKLIGDVALCTTQSAQLARVLGEPVLLVGGAPSMTAPELRYRLARWTGRGWGPSCSYRVRWRTTLQSAARFCAPGHQTVCEAGQALALRLAQSYEALQTEGRFMDFLALNEGREPDAEVTAALNPPLEEPNTVGHVNPPFPRFGAGHRGHEAMRSGFSNVDPRVLPFWVEGRWWLAVVGRSGVGWREGDAVLVALFAPPGRLADAVASYQFLVVPTGLQNAVAADERP